MTGLMRALKALANEQPPCVNPVACTVAHGMALAIDRAGLDPYGVTPIADGGIAIRFRAGARTARIETTPDGEVVLVTQRDPEAIALFTDVNRLEAVSMLAGFLADAEKSDLGSG